MSNYNERKDKIEVHLTELYTRHRSLDVEIKQMYNQWERDDLIQRKKTAKLCLKDEIHRLESDLKAL